MEREDIQKLIAIRDLDVRIMETTAELDELPEEYALEEHAAQEAQGEVDARDRGLHDARLAAQHAEADVKEQDEHIKKYSEQLATAKTNKEYSVILGQINEAKMELARAEEAGLEALENVETHSQGLEEARRQLAERQRELEEAKGRVAGRQQELEREIAEMRGKRERIAAELDAELVRAYDHIRERREGIAVVEVQDGTCQGCFVKVTAQEQQLITQGDELVRCRMCARILVPPAVT